MTAPVNFADASSRYRTGDVRVSEKITDRENDDGGGYPAFENGIRAASAESRRCSSTSGLSLSSRATDLSDNKELEALLARTDLKKLAALK